MRLIKAAVLVTIITVMSSGNVVAGFESGNSLLDECRSEIGDVSFSYCQGYVTAIADVLGDGVHIAGWTSCLPEGATIGQIKDIVQNALEAHPQDRHYTAASLVAEALAEAFPCKE